MLKSRQKIRISREMMEEKPTIMIGKKGLTATLIQEITKQLKRSKTVKIKSIGLPLKDEGPRTMIEEICRSTNSALVEIRGNTFILCRRKKEAPKLDTA